MGSSKFKEYKGLDLPAVNSEVLERWDAVDAFGKSISTREGHPTFVFYEGPPSANGMPGIHHVMARTIKDVVCRYKTQRGFLVHRKAGWDTHGLPVELGVEKKLGITKEDIGTKISIEEYNRICRKEVMTYTDAWERLTRRMGYWIDMKDPYITYDNKYIETLWHLLAELYKKGLLYKGYTIQPYSPAAGTGLSNHELNQPGCYRDVKDTTCTALFRIVRDQQSERLFDGADGDVYFMAWTTTPWTLPSNTALAVGPAIRYVRVRSFNPYTGAPLTVFLAKDLCPAYFPKKNEDLPMDGYEAGGKNVPFRVEGEYVGKDLAGIRYEPLLPWIAPDGDAFRVITGDYVTTEDGTGIVHIAPTFGADDDRVAKQSGIPPLVVVDRAGKRQPMVDRTGKFFRLEDLDPEFVRTHVDAAAYGEFAGRFVKNAYDPTLSEADPTLDVDLCMKLKFEGKAFRIEKHTHNYPHCWRTDKPVLYYPLDSWFIRTTAVKDRLIALNRTIDWKPESTGSGRFGKWLENLVDWNLSRSRYWGTPLPIWATEDHGELKCIGSVAELKAEIDRSVEAGFMSENPLKDFAEGDFSKENYAKFDLHRPYVDQIVLVSSRGERMMREPDLIDVWFDSGAMPYAQAHYPFEIDGEEFRRVYPADFVAEGVDQTRGWFFTLHALATMLFDSVAFRHIISNGLVLDKNGNKMSKRLGNAVDPFEVIEKYGSDAVRWYMISNSQPWDNLKFDVEGVDEVRRKFFGTLYNTYSFFALYANIDSFTGAEPEVPVAERPEIDRWIISLLHTLVRTVTDSLESYDPTPAARAIQEFVCENLSNWYVRLNRKRFWGGGLTRDKLAAYQTLYACLETVAQLAAPFAPFITDRIFTDLNAVSGRHGDASVHLSDFPSSDPSLVVAGPEGFVDGARPEAQSGYQSASAAGENRRSGARPGAQGAYRGGREPDPERGERQAARVHRGYDGRYHQAHQAELQDAGAPLRKADEADRGFGRRFLASRHRSTGAYGSLDGRRRRRAGRGYRSRFRHHVGGYAGMAGGYGGQTDRRYGYHCDRGTAARRCGTGIGEPHPEHSQRERLRRNGQDPRDDRAPRGACRGGRIVRRLHCRADAGRFGRYGRCVGDARGAGDRDRRSESRLVGRKGIDCPALFAEPCEIVCLFIK